MTPASGPLAQTRHFAPSRAAGLERLANFLPQAGAHYASWRNHDRGPDQRGNVSGLSPYLRHRLLTEAEVLAAVLARHSPSDAGMFVQEVFWRTYFKGHCIEYDVIDMFQMMVDVALEPRSVMAANVARSKNKKSHDLHKHLHKYDPFSDN